MIHPRVSLHQVAFLDEPSTDFIAFCREAGVPWMTLVTPKLSQPGDFDGALAELAKGGPDVATVNHVFAAFPNLEGDRERAVSGLTEAIDMAAALGAGAIYLITGGRGRLSWEEGAARFADWIAPCRDAAAKKGVRLLVENASALNADLHMVHTLADAIRFAEIAGIGVCIELHACWTEADLPALFRRGMPLTGLVQASDYVLGDRSTPCRAVPGDGVIPLERLLGDVLAAGYTGVFDLELVGPRIVAEGARPASLRAAERLSEILVKLGA